MDLFTRVAGPAEMMQFVRVPNALLDQQFTECDADVLHQSFFLEDVFVLATSPVVLDKLYCSGSLA